MVAKRVRCDSGLTGWQTKLQDNYLNFDEFLAYAEVYNLHSRCGYGTPEEAWQANPSVQSSVEPADFRRLD